jgi:hypothetical protein
MISSVSSNRFATQQADYFQRQSLTPTNDPTQEVKEDTALKSDATKSSGSERIGSLSEADLKTLSELKQRDSEVRAHEAAHLAAAGGFATSGANYKYEQGPDGVRYAISGEVSIDTSPVANDPAATLLKADTIRRAALAPAEPSGPDMQVAANAAAMAAKAQAELLRKNQDTQNGNKDQLGIKINLSA